MGPLMMMASSPRTGRLLRLSNNIKALLFKLQNSL